MFSCRQQVTPFLVKKAKVDKYFLTNWDLTSKKFTTIKSSTLKLHIFNKPLPTKHPLKRVVRYIPIEILYQYTISLLLQIQAIGCFVKNIRFFVSTVQHTCFIGELDNNFITYFCVDFRKTLRYHNFCAGKTLVRYIY